MVSIIIFSISLIGLIIFLTIKMWEIKTEKTLVSESALLKIDKSLLKIIYFKKRLIVNLLSIFSKYLKIYSSLLYKLATFLVFHIFRFIKKVIDRITKKFLATKKGSKVSSFLKRLSE
ncbi:hypothetical protein ACFLY7_01475 [Patescibacteria group bacterium]